MSALPAAGDPARLGILGGSFNPPHRGHLALADQARVQLSLERVLLVPAHTAPFKTARNEDPGPIHRLRMCELSALGEPGLRVCAIEIDRGGVSYTVDTLRSLHASHPRAELTLILGADVASTLSTWREPAQVLELAHVAVARRPDAETAPLPENATLLEMAPLELSSSIVRERVARGEPVAALVGEAVAAYIAEHDLYRTRTEVIR